MAAENEMTQGTTATKTPADISEYLEGRKLYGDDFDPEAIAVWFRNQREAYADLGAKDTHRYKYAYHALNIENGFRYLPPGRFRRVLGIGSAYGHEFEPIKDRIDDLVIVDPSDTFASDRVLGIATKYLKPRSDGVLELADASFDLITCFAVLQHIPNVTAVLREIQRCLKPGGHALIRDAIISLGDWRFARPGVTREQRGIPLPLFRERIRASGFEILRETKCMFSLTSQLLKVTDAHVYNSPVIARIDRALSSLFGWNTRYHRTRLHQKFGPWSVFYVLTK